LFSYLCLSLSKNFLSFKFPQQNSVRISDPFRASYLSPPSHYPLCNEEQGVTEVWSEQGKEHIGSIEAGGRVVSRMNVAFSVKAMYNGYCASQQRAVLNCRAFSLAYDCS
jgi:hypothetical protein